MNIVIRNGRVVDPVTGLDDKRDILIKGNEIDKVAPNLPVPEGRQ